MLWDYETITNSGENHIRIGSVVTNDFCKASHKGGGGGTHPMHHVL